MFLSCRDLLCETCWGKGHLGNKVLEYGIISLFPDSYYFKESSYCLVEKGVHPLLMQVSVGFYATSP